MSAEEQPLHAKMESEEDPYHLFRKVMELTGLAKNYEAKNKKLFLPLKSWLIIGLVIETTAIVLYVVEDHSFDDKIEALQCLVSIIQLLTKVTNLMLRGSNLKRLIDESTAVWREMSAHKENQQLLRRIRKDMNIRIKFMMGLFITATPTYAIISLAMNLPLEPEKRETLFKLWDPFKDTLGHDYYLSRFAFHAFFMEHGLTIFGAVYTSYFIPCFMAAAQMKVLTRMLSSKDLNLSACVKLHQKNRKFVMDLLDMFSGQMFVEMVSSALPITLRGYQLILMLKNSDPRAFGVAFLLILCYGGPLVVCFSGQLIRDASEALFLGIYQNEWYNLNPKDSKSLCIMMSQASKYLDLGYKNVMVFNMERYMLVMQASYSYITFLLNYDH